jgi:hypothetical protein
MIHAYQNRCALCDKLFDTPDKRQFSCPGCRRRSGRRRRIRAQIMRILDALGFGLCVLVVWVAFDWLLDGLGIMEGDTPTEIARSVIGMTVGYWVGKGGFRRRV